MSNRAVAEARPLSSGPQHRFEQVDRARIAALPEPEQRLTAHAPIPIGAGDLEQLRNAFIAWERRQNEDRVRLEVLVLALRLFIPGRPSSSGSAPRPARTPRQVARVARA